MSWDTFLQHNSREQAREEDHPSCSLLPASQIQIVGSCENPSECVELFQVFSAVMCQVHSKTFWRLKQFHVCSYSLGEENSHCIRSIYIFSCAHVNAGEEEHLIDFTLMDLLSWLDFTKAISSHLCRRQFQLFVHNPEVISSLRFHLSPFCWGVMRAGPSVLLSWFLSPAVGVGPKT